MVIPTHTPPDGYSEQVRIDVTACMNIILKRDYLLETEVDPIMSVPSQWNALTSEQQASWTTYQADLEAVDPRFPALVTWPTKPE